MSAKETKKVVHKFSHDLDACQCGGQWVYFDGVGPNFDIYGYGCEVEGKPARPKVDGMGRRIR